MGILYQGQKIAKPLHNGVPHNMLHNGKKIFPSAERVVRIPKTTEATAAQWFWASDAVQIPLNPAWWCHDGDKDTGAISEFQGSVINWLVYDMGAQGKRIDHVVWDRVYLENTYLGGWIILTNTKPDISMIPADKVILRYNASSSGWLINQSFDSPDKTNRYRYLAFSESYGGNYSQFQEVDIYEIK
jgi:hypothetical protein